MARGSYDISVPALALQGPAPKATSRGAAQVQGRGTIAGAITLTTESRDAGAALVRVGARG